MSEIVGALAIVVALVAAAWWAGRGKEHARHVERRAKAEADRADMLASAEERALESVGAGGLRRGILGTVDRIRRRRRG